MDADGLARAWAVVARIADIRAVGYNAYPYAWDSVIAPGLEIDATPALIALARGVIGIAENAGAGRGWWRTDTYAGGECIGCGACAPSPGGEIRHAEECPALAAEDAMRALAALAGDGSA